MRLRVYMCVGVQKHTHIHTHANIHHHREYRENEGRCAERAETRSARESRCRLVPQFLSATQSSSEMCVGGEGGREVGR